MRIGLPRTLHAKLLSVVLATTLVALTMALGLMAAYDLRSYTREWSADMVTQAELLGQTITPALAFDDAKVAQDNLRLLRLRPNVRAAAVYDAQGRLFASYAADASNGAPPETISPDGMQLDGGTLVMFKHLTDNGEFLGTVYLRASYDMRQRILSYAGIALAVLATSMLVALLLSSRLQKIVTRPILAISATAREVMTHRDYSQRTVQLSNDEVGELAVSFNSMMAEIERRSLENEAAMREIAREIEQRRLTQQEVMRLNEGLEHRVHERTAQLEASNRDLVRATDAAEEANRAKSEFISSMSHELRTPLNAILGFGQLLSMDNLSLPAAKRAEFTSHILKAGNHLLNLINEILDLARIESANLMLSLEPVALAEVLQECRTMVEPAAGQRHISVVFPQDTPLCVIADRTRLKQVLLNLLSNAIKYNRELGSVVVDCTETAPGRVRISVRDTGIGLSTEQRCALFQPFNRLGQETSTIEGTGIGLVVTKRLVELMGGSIDVASTVGIGTVFGIELQAAEAAFCAPQPEPRWTAATHAQQEAAARPVLLYIEDNPANLRLVEEILAVRADLRLLSAPDAQLGIEMARAHAPQVILMDINLPGLSGSDAQEILRGDPKTAHIPIIAVTANAMPRDIAQGLAAGFFRYVTKPINLEKLNEAIDSALARSTAGATVEGPVSQH